MTETGAVADRVGNARWREMGRKQPTDPLTGIVWEMTAAEADAIDRRKLSPPRTTRDLDRRIIDLAIRSREAERATWARVEAAGERNGDSRGEGAHKVEWASYELVIDPRGLAATRFWYNTGGGGELHSEPTQLRAEHLPPDHPLRAYAEDGGGYPLTKGYVVPKRRWATADHAVEALAELRRAGVRCWLVGPCHTTVVEAMTVVFGRSGVRERRLVVEAMRRLVAARRAVWCRRGGVEEGGQEQAGIVVAADAGKAL